MCKRIFARLLRLYPEHFREAHGEEYLQLIRDCSRGCPPTIAERDRNGSAVPCNQVAKAVRHSWCSAANALGEFVFCLEEACRF